MTARRVDIPAGMITVDNHWIDVADGVRLHARIWRPADSDVVPVPALLEYLPYRLDDWTSVRDSERHPWYAAHGYASVRVDIRGTGSSGGLFDDEYSEQELADGETVIAWLAAQPWCTGRVGMFGISWGGFNALQLAQRAPEALRAIVTVCSTDDRFDNDVHYMGGAVLGVDMTAWAATMFSFCARPPRPEVVGHGWVDQWRERLRHLRPLAPIWLSHQERDAYWQRGSVCEDYAAVRAAVLAVGGWSDPYRDTVFRLVEHLSAPVKGIIGPWSHQYPDRDRAPGPSIGFLQETLRWWDRWLKDGDTGVEDDPDLRVWLNRDLSPETWVAERNGRWVAVPDWVGVRDWSGLPLSDAVGARDRPTTIEVASDWDTGQDAGRFFPFGNESDLPPDQRAEDGRSVCWDFSVGSEPVSILGNPRVRLRVSSSTPRAHLIVRLCEVSPDGVSRLVTRGVLNLAKLRGMDRADDLTPGVMEDVTVQLVSIGHEFTPGNTIRLAVSNHYWPWVWPHEDDGSLLVETARSVLELPVAPEHVGPPVIFEPAEHARPIATRAPWSIRPDFDDPLEGSDLPERVVSRDVTGQRTTLSVDPNYGGTNRYPDGLDYLEVARETYRISLDEPHAPEAVSTWQVQLTGDGWAARIQTRSRITSEPGEFVIENHVRGERRVEADSAWEVVGEQRFIDRVPRTSA